jgi:hypothetical protein
VYLSRASHRVPRIHSSRPCSAQLWLCYGTCYSACLSWRCRTVVLSCWSWTRTIMISRSAFKCGEHRIGLSPLQNSQQAFSTWLFRQWQLHLVEMSNSANELCEMCGTNFTTVSVPTQPLKINTLETKLRELTEQPKSCGLTVVGFFERFG